MKKILLGARAQLSSLMLVCISIYLPFFTQAQSVTVSGNDITAIHTDFNTYFFSSSSALSSTEPNSAHNLLAFLAGSTTYSTGVNDTELSNQSVSFDPQTFVAFEPFTATSNQAGMGSNDDGNTGTLTPIYAVGSTDVSPYISDGTQGLGMSTFANNVGGTFVFNLTDLDSDKVNDGVPDLIYFNGADPAPQNVSFTFRNSNGDQLGNIVQTVEGTGRATIANTRVDRYDTTTGNRLGALNAQKGIQGFYLELSAFDNGSFDLSEAATLELVLPVQADPPFVAYNNTAFLASLPVNLSSFFVKESGGRVELDWITQSEQNNDYFEVQRSSDTRIWEAVTRVPGQGTTPSFQSYTYTDFKPLAGLSYYRLKQVDFDGTAHFHPVRSVYIEKEALDPIQIYPQPAGDHLYIQIPSDWEHTNLSFYNYQGRRLFQKSTFIKQEEMELDLSNYSKGLYFILISTDQEVFKKQVVIQ